MNNGIYLTRTKMSIGNRAVGWGMGMVATKLESYLVDTELAKWETFLTKMDKHFSFYIKRNYNLYIFL